VEAGNLGQEKTWGGRVSMSTVESDQGSTTATMWRAATRSRRSMCRCIVLEEG